MNNVLLMMAHLNGRCERRGIYPIRFLGFDKTVFVVKKVDRVRRFKACITTTVLFLVYYCMHHLYFVLSFKRLINT